MPLPYLACMLAVSAAYHLPQHVLPSIQAVEGGYPGAEHLNSDGSTDLGVMQINTRWVQPIREYAISVGHPPMTEAQTRRLLTIDPCFNIAMAAAILQYEWRQAGHDWLTAVGNYHSHTAELHQSYLAQVTAKARMLFAAGG